MRPAAGLFPIQRVEGGAALLPRFLRWLAVPTHRIFGGLLWEAKTGN